MPKSAEQLKQEVESWMLSQDPIATMLAKADERLKQVPPDVIGAAVNLHGARLAMGWLFAEHTVLPKEMTPEMVAVWQGEFQAQLRRRTGGGRVSQAVKRDKFEQAENVAFRAVERQFGRKFTVAPALGGQPDDL